MDQPLLVAMNEAKKSYDTYCENQAREEKPARIAIKKVVKRFRRASKSPKALNDKSFEKAAGSVTAIKQELP